MKQVILHYLVALLLLVVSVGNNLWAKQNLPQTPKNKKEAPYSFKHKLKTKVVANVLDPQAAYDKLTKEQMNRFQDISQYLGSYGKFKATLDSSGTWETLPNGDRLWRLKLSTQSNLITGIGIHSSDMTLPKGGKLFFYSDDKKFVAGPVTEPNHKSAKQLLVNTIPGKTIWVEYYEPKAQKNKSTFNIDALLYRFVGFPYGITHQLKKTVPFVNPYPKDKDERIIKNNATVRVGELSGAEQTTDYTLDNSGIWEDLPNGDRVWRMGIETTLGFAISLKTVIEIPKNGYLSFYTPDGLYVSTRNIRPTNEYNNELYPSGLLGKKVIVEYYEPKAAKGKGKVQILYVAIDLTKWFASALDREADDLGEPVCVPNVRCGCDDFEYRINNLPPKPTTT